jgi:cysteine desulfurase/selenocysteine lyase
MVLNGKTDFIIVSDAIHEHYENYLLWLRVSKIKGVKLNELEIDENGYFELATLQWLAKEKDTELITLSHAFYNNGAIMSVQEIGKLQKKMAYYIV